MANTKITASLLDPAQTSITSLGTLSALTISGDLTVDTSTLKVDSSNNRVGIGTATPGSLLHLSGTGVEKIIIEQTSAQRGNYIGITGGDNLEIAADEDNLGPGSSIRFRIDADEKMRINSDGEVGIGTQSPAYALDVDSTIHIGNDGSSGYTHSRLIFDSNGSVRGAGSFFHNQANDVEYFAGNPYDAADSFAITRAATASHNEATANVTNSLFIIKSDGKVGIGATSPSTILHIKETGSTSAVNEFIRIENSAGGGAAAGSSINFHHYHAGGGPAGGAKAASITAQNMAAWPGGTPSSYSSGLTFGTLHENTFAERMRISSDGKVGIGVTSPSSTLDISAPANIPPLEINAATDGANYVTIRNAAASDVAYFGIGTALISGAGTTDFALRAQAGNMVFATGGNTERMRIDSAGNIGIGHVPESYGSGYHAIDIGDYMGIMAGKTGSAAYITDNAYWDGSNFKAKNTAAGSLYQQAGGTHRFHTMVSTSADANYTVNERVRITQNGQFLVGKTSDSNSDTGGMITPQGPFYSSMNGSVYNTYHYYDTNSSAYKFYIGGNGQVFASTNTVGVISDERLKENIRDYEVGLEDILKLQPRMWDWKENEGKNIKNDIGFVAQEFEKVFPDWVGTFLHDDLEDAKSVGAGDIIFPMVNAIKELKAEIDALKEKLNG